jgi:hypothetical protein
MTAQAANPVIHVIGDEKKYVGPLERWRGRLVGNESRTAKAMGGSACGEGLEKAPAIHRVYHSRFSYLSQWVLLQGTVVEASFLLLSSNLDLDRFEMGFYSVSHMCHN